LSGCIPQAIQENDSIFEVEGMSEEYRPQLSRVTLHDSGKITEYPIIYIEELTWNKGLVQNEDFARDCSIYIRERLYIELARTGTFLIVSCNPKCIEKQSEGYRVLSLKQKITRADYGAGWKRYFQAFIPFLMLSWPGATDLQVEGRLYDGSSDIVILDFAARERTLGNTIIGPSPHTFKKEYVMRMTGRNFCVNFAGFIKDLWVKSGGRLRRTANDKEDEKD